MPGLDVGDDAKQSRLGEGAELVPEVFGDAFVVDEGGLDDIRDIVSFLLAMGGDADHGEGRRNVLQFFMEGCAGMANGDANKVDFH